MSYIFLDVDNTLFSPEINAIPESSLVAIEKARANGHKVFLCTGRSLAECIRYLNNDVDGFIFGAGGMVYAEGHRIFDQPLPRDMVEEYLEKANEKNIPTTLEAAAGCYCNEGGYEAMRKYYASGKTDLEEIRKAIEANGSYSMEYRHESDPVYKMCFFLKDYEECVNLQKSIQEPYKLTILIEDPFIERWITELTHGEISKATGIQKVLAYYGANKEDAIGIGDSANDYPMFEACGIKIAMGNANAELKEMADYVTTDILKDGIYNAFKQYRLI